jgi:hypothetical protein
LNWLEEFGDVFGWRRTHSLDELQEAANEGEIGIMVAQRIDLNRSGHIVVVAPERDGHQARRSAGSVSLPLQSQAGVKNRKLGSGSTAWWQDAKFRDFAFFIRA